jgi:endonuclease/exonuclease/phosphatase (EEP) superfamily protein YafD
LLTWNVHKEAGAGFDAELRRFSDAADLVLIQETTWRRSPAVLPPVWTFAITFERRQDGRPAGVATASGTEPSTLEARWSPDTEPFVRVHKAALLTTYELARGGPLMVVNLHGIIFRAAGALRRQLADVEGRLRGFSGPIVVAGDFNAWSRKRRTVLNAFADRLGLLGVFVGDDAPRFDQVFTRKARVVQHDVLTSDISDHDALWVELAVCN